MTADQLAEHLFDVADQLNRGAEKLIERAEKAHVAAIDLSAGRKAKASAAYVSACAYLAAGMALLDERDWESQYELMFSLWFERAECEFLSGNFEEAEQLIVDLLQHAASKVDQAATYRLKVLLHTLKSENAASRRQRALVPAPVRHRHAGTPDPGAGPGRIRDGLADPRRTADRKPDRSADDDRSGKAGRDASAIGPPLPRLPYRLPLMVLARVPHSEGQHGARDERRVRAWLRRSRPNPWTRISPL